MIPYLAPPPALSLFGLRVPIFGLLLFLSLLATHSAITLRARALVRDPATARATLTPEAAGRFAKLILLAAIGGAHLGGILVAHGLSAIREPALFSSGNDSFSAAGGLLVAAIVAGLYLRFRREPFRPWADLVAFAFPIGLFIARAGCALAHDHPGQLSTSWLAVRFPEGSRFDCGLLELLAAPWLIALTWALARRSLPPGGLAGAIGAAYVVVRFPLDFLRAGDLPRSDPRWLGLTFMQWLCGPLLVASLYLLLARPAADTASKANEPPA